MAGTWYQWADTTNATTTGVSAWVSWVSSSEGTSATSDNRTVWRLWSSGTAYTYYGAHRQEEPTQEQRDRWEQERRDREARQAEEARVRAEAETRAMALLDEHLEPAQREQLAVDNHFVAIDNVGRTWRLLKKVAGNLELLDAEGKVQQRYCVHPREVPVGDVLLAQLFALKTAPEEMLAVANRM